MSKRLIGLRTATADCEFLFSRRTNAENNFWVKTVAVVAAVLSENNVAFGNCFRPDMYWKPFPLLSPPRTRLFLVYMHQRTGHVVCGVWRNDGRTHLMLSMLFIRSFIHLFIHSCYFYSASSKSTTTQRRSRHSTDTVSEFHAEAPQATARHRRQSWRFGGSQSPDFGMRGVVGSP